jgi:pyridoxamine 5'-phosphate oxidase
LVNQTLPKHPAGIRRDYGDLSLTETEALASPFQQFEHWFSDARVHEHDDPTAMVLSTVDAKGHPDARVVLLKGLASDAFVFYTNYDSVKSMEIQAVPYVALTFYWSKMARQVRIRGSVQRVSEAQSDAYFATRPVLSQLSALASSQSQALESREILEQRLEDLKLEYQHQPVPRPAHWGGFAVTPSEMEFWQGRDNRLHDRIHYTRQADQWLKRRLAP